MRPIGVGIVGLGLFGVRHLKTYRSLPNARVVSVCDVDAKRARTVAETYGIGHWTTEVAELLAHKEVEAVSIVTPEHLHAAPFFQALAAGKHVLVEKPLSSRPEEALEMAEATRSSSVVAMPGHILRFDPRYVQVKERIRQGKLGEVRTIYARRNVPVWMREHYRRTHLALLNMIHDIDLGLWYLGSRLRNVHARALPLEAESGAAEANDARADIVWAMVEFESGALGVFESGYVLPNGSGRGMDVQMDIVGSKSLAHIYCPGASIGFSGAGGHTWEDPVLWLEVDGSPTGAIKEEIGYFLQCIRRGEAPSRVTLDDAAEAVRVAHAIIEAVRCGAQGGVES